ncbi:multidrug and toxin extrusion protein 2 isoform X14 [Ovis canadensis]|uniref:multidrug and toxin extrusion protein 2 isoform X14 n=1 Tax=Ovis canadensis TaxID=37174 RepID=UPI003751CD12
MALCWCWLQLVLWPAPSHEMPGCPERPRDRRWSPREAPADRRHPRQTVPLGLVPVGFGAEARTLFVLSGPLFLFQMLNFMVYVVSTVFCGHLGTVELAAVTLSVAFVNVCGVSVGFGLSSACDTLMSQANFLYSLQAKYLQNQGIVWPQVFSGVVGNCVNALANYVLVSVLGQGVRGSAFANTVSQFSQAVFLLFYIVLKKLHLETWAGWSWECLQDWGPFFRLAIPSMLMLCIEWWAYEIGSFLVGLLSVLDLSAQAVIYEVATVIYMIPMGLSIAVCVRVGTALGAADTVQAKRSAISGTLCTVGTSLVVGILLSLLRNKLGHIFTNDEEVVALVNKVLPLYIFFQLFDALCCLYAGVLRGTGRQAFGAVVNAVMYYAIGLPLGVVLTFLVGMGIMGLWLGMLVCVILATAAFVTYTARMDWKRAAEEAQKHAGLPPLESTDSMAFRTRPGPEKVVVSSGLIVTTQLQCGQEACSRGLGRSAWLDNWCGGPFSPTPPHPVRPELCCPGAGLSPGLCVHRP